MIAAHLFKQVQQLLAEGKLSHRKIERITGVSRGTIGAIASGKKGIGPRSEDDTAVSDVPPERCPDCGGMVYMPCRSCHTQKAMAMSATLRALVKTRARRPNVLLGLNLKPVHRERYEEVRRWRVALAEPVAHKSMALAEPVGRGGNLAKREFSRSDDFTRIPGEVMQMTHQQMQGND
jgi:hypothetical protein